MRWALVLALLGAAAPRADAAPTRAERKRAVAVVEDPAAPLPEVRVAAATPTLLFFPAIIAKSTLTVDAQPRTVDAAALPAEGARIRLLDVGERSVLVQPIEDLRPGEHHELAVSFADGRAPARAAFVLVTEPAEVDARIEVERPAPRDVGCPAEAPRPPPRPEDLVLLGYVDEHGVQTGTVAEASEGAEGLTSGPGATYRGSSWLLVDVKIFNAAGRPPWTPREATLTGRGGGELRARLVLIGDTQAVPRGSLRVLAVSEASPTSADDVLTLRVRGSGGRSLEIPNVRLPKRAAEGGR